jgi:hypothetical protein
MFRKIIAPLSLALGLVLLAPAIRGIGSGSAWAQAQGNINVNYYDYDGGADGTVHVINPTWVSPSVEVIVPPAGSPITASTTIATSGILCANIYVFDTAQELIECCGCPVTNNGLRTIDEFFDLTSNPKAMPPPFNAAGVIKILSSGPNNTGDTLSLLQFGICNPAFPPVANPQGAFTLREYATHGKDSRTVTESEFLESPPTAAEVTNLTENCTTIHQNGTGHGICSCGVGDSLPEVAAAKKS